jgi:flagellar biosynthesis protein FlhB
VAIDADDMTMRTEMPTPLRLEEARRRGQVARSADLTATAVLIAGAALLAVLGPWLLKNLTSMTAYMLSEAGGVAPAEAALGGISVKAAAVFLAVAAPMLLAMAFVAVVINVVQVGLLATAEPLRPELARLSLAAGLRRIFSARSFARGALGLVKVLAVATVAYVTIKPSLSRLVTAGNHSPGGMIGQTGKLLGELSLRLGVVLFALAVVDWLYQRWQHRQDLKMTRREWLEDLKRMEGGRRIRAKRRSANRES